MQVESGQILPRIRHDLHKSRRVAIVVIDQPAYIHDKEIIGLPLAVQVLAKVTWQHSAL